MEGPLAQFGVAQYARRKTSTQQRKTVLIEVHLYAWLAMSLPSVPWRWGWAA